MKNINASKLGKLSHKKNPRSKEFYQKMQKAMIKKRKQKLSPTINLRKQTKEI